MSTMLEATADTLLPEAMLYIDGVIRRAEGGKTYDNIGPWTGEVIGVSADASAADVEEAIAAARRAFDTTDWSTNHGYRIELIKKFYALCSANKDRFSDIVRHEAGRRWSRSIARSSAWPSTVGRI